MILWLANLLSAVTPQTRWFGLRRAAYRAAGVDVAGTAEVNGTVRIHYPNVSIGERTWLGAGAQVISTSIAKVTIGARCDVGPGVMLVAGTHTIGGHERRAGPGDSAPISIGEGTWVGARALFLAGTVVGAGCVVAAGAVVRGEFPDDVLIAGVPAAVVRHF
ncbi:acyltransferase [Georgenia sp. Marseille-Q6866]